MDRLAEPLLISPWWPLQHDGPIGIHGRGDQALVDRGVVRLAEDLADRAARRPHLVIERVKHGVSDPELIARLEIALGHFAMLEDERILAARDVLGAQVAADVLEPNVHRGHVAVIDPEIATAAERGDLPPRQERQLDQRGIDPQRRDRIDAAEIGAPLVGWKRRGSDKRGHEIEGARSCASTQVSKHKPPAPAAPTPRKRTEIFRRKNASMRLDGEIRRLLAEGCDTPIAKPWNKLRIGGL